MEPTEELIAWILSEIERGESQAAIAGMLGVVPSTVSRWLDASPELEQRSALARSRSAEAWLDKGWRILEDALHDPAFKGTGTDSSIARQMAQECARRAAIRNPAYREKTDAKLELSGPGGGPVRTIAATVTPEQAALAYKELIG